MSRKKRIPKLRSEEEEHDFWSEHDSTDYIDWSKARRVAFPNLTRHVEESNGSKRGGREN